MPRMPTKELREKYAKSNLHAAENAAIRAELVGGNEALDAHELLHQAAGRKDDPAAATIGRALVAVRAIVDAMRAEIRRRYQIPE